MTAKIKLPVIVVTVGPRTHIVERDGGNVVASISHESRAREIAGALNATARRCDGCALYQPYPERYGSPFEGQCTYRGGETDADDYCRKGWEAR